LGTAQKSDFSTTATMMRTNRSSTSAMLGASRFNSKYVRKIYKTKKCERNVWENQLTCILNMLNKFTWFTRSGAGALKFSKMAKVQNCSQPRPEKILYINNCVNRVKLRVGRTRIWLW
jgi:hypothetical protein